MYKRDDNLLQYGNELIERNFRYESSYFKRRKHSNEFSNLRAIYEKRGRVMLRASTFSVLTAEKNGGNIVKCTVRAEKIDESRHIIAAHGRLEILEGRRAASIYRPRFLLAKSAAHQWRR